MSAWLLRLILITTQIFTGSSAKAAEPGLSEALKCVDEATWALDSKKPRTKIRPLIVTGVLTLSPARGPEPGFWIVTERRAFFISDRELPPPPASVKLQLPDQTISATLRLNRASGSKDVSRGIPQGPETPELVLSKSSPAGALRIRLKHEIINNEMREALAGHVSRIWSQISRPDLARISIAHDICAASLPASSGNASLDLQQRLQFLVRSGEKATGKAGPAADNAIDVAK